jgi:hypothetical protein
MDLAIVEGMTAPANSFPNYQTVRGRALVSALFSL